MRDSSVSNNSNQGNSSLAAYNSNCNTVNTAKGGNKYS
jgi:hypothetical protein